MSQRGTSFGPLILQTRISNPLPFSDSLKSRIDQILSYGMHFYINQLRLLALLWLAFFAGHVACFRPWQARL
jgi:hypothetical protein